MTTEKALPADILDCQHTHLRFVQDMPIAHCAKCDAQWTRTASDTFDLLGELSQPDISTVAQIDVYDSPKHESVRRHRFANGYLTYVAVEDLKNGGMFEIGHQHLDLVSMDSYIHCLGFIPKLD
ncbi:MAG: hypothetical protein RLZZ234_881 [Candidatus Parcubacteria bacterium]|jgi:hypothetical protein